MLYRVKKYSSFLLFGTLFLSIMTACGQLESDSSDLLVTNGQEIPETEYPSAVLLLMQTARGSSICTATFVNDRQAVTASHCVAGLDPRNPSVNYVTVESVGTRQTYRRVAKALSFQAQAEYTMDLNNGVNRYDLAIVNFPARTAPAISPIAKQTPELGVPIVIVGYGNNENFFSGNSQGGNGSGVKRFGSNQLQLVDDGMLVFAGVPSKDPAAAPGELVSSGSGDSGGPMFVGNQIVGVTSGGGLAVVPTGETISISRYVDLNSDVSRAFLRRYLLR